jgi:hypothetical protein
VDANRPYRPGERAPRTGYYWVVRYGEWAPTVRLRLAEGQTFPSKLGWLFWFDEPELKPVDQVEN